PAHLRVHGLTLRGSLTSQDAKGKVKNWLRMRASERRSVMGYKILSPKFLRAFRVRVLFRLVADTMETSLNCHYQPISSPRRGLCWRSRNSSLVYRIDLSGIFPSMAVRLRQSTNAASRARR